MCNYRGRYGEMRLHSENGFGLIEVTMLIVVAGIVIGIALQSMTVVVNDVRRAETEREMERLATAITGDPAVMQMLAWAIQAAKRTGRKIGICGQAPSDYPEVARFLVEQGIDSLSLNPDAVIRTTQALLDVEDAREARKEPRAEP